MKSVTYQCDLCKLDTLTSDEVVGVLVNRSDGLKYSGAPEDSKAHVCLACAKAVSTGFEARLTVKS